MNKEKNNTAPQTFSAPGSMPSEEGNFWYDLLKQEDNLFTNRNNFFLVGEAMLLAAAATLLPAKGNFNPLATIAICLAGILTSLICLLANTRHIFVTEVFIKNQLKRTHPWWQAARDDRKGAKEGRPWWVWIEILLWKRIWKKPQISVPSRRWVKMHVWTGILLPVILLLLWVSFFVATLRIS